MTKLMIRNSNERLGFWFPIVLPILMGLIPAFAKMASEMGTSAGIYGTMSRMLELAAEETADPRTLVDNLQVDVVAFWGGLCEGISSAMIAVDVWALTMLFAAPRDQRSSHAYAYPVVGIFLHFVIVLMVVCFVVLGSFSDTHLHVFYGGATVATLGAIVVGWFVRRGVWLHYDSNLVHESIAAEQAQSD